MADQKYPLTGNVNAADTGDPWVIAVSATLLPAAKLRGVMLRMLALKNCKAILDNIFDDSRWAAEHSHERVTCAAWFVFRFNKRTSDQTRAALQNLIGFLQPQVPPEAQRAPIFAHLPSVRGNATRPPPPSGVRHRIPQRPKQVYAHGSRSLP